ncbi:hypothetical protein [Ponticoccus litoralis]|uniref:Uncharacterized protein n=1 Tax=Ponticoccus litoralis TaxID=422297 RepID=A0AAW9SN06_9RHOB
MSEEGGAVLGILPDRRQRLVQLVADARRHLPQRAQLARLHKVGLRPAQRRLGILALAHLGAQPAVGLFPGAGARAHPALQQDIGLGQRAAPLGGDEQQRAEEQAERDHRRHLKRRQPPRRGDIDKRLCRQVDDRQRPRQMQAGRWDIGAEILAPDRMPARARDLQGLRLAPGADHPRAVAAPEQDLGAVGDKDLPAVIGEEDRGPCATPFPFEDVEVDHQHQRPLHLAVCRKGRRRVDIAPGARRRHLVAEAKRAGHGPPVPGPRRQILRRPPKALASTRPSLSA